MLFLEYGPGGEPLKEFADIDLACTKGNCDNTPFPNIDQIKNFPLKEELYLAIGTTSNSNFLTININALNHDKLINIARLFEHGEQFGSSLLEINPNQAAFFYYLAVKNPCATIEQKITALAQLANLYYFGDQQKWPVMANNIQQEIIEQLNLSNISNKAIIDLIKSLQKLTTILPNNTVLITLFEMLEKRKVAFELYAIPLFEIATEYKSIFKDGAIRDKGLVAIFTPVREQIIRHYTQLKNKAFFKSTKQRYEKGIDLWQKIIDNPDRPENYFVLAQFYFDAKINGGNTIDNLLVWLRDAHNPFIDMENKAWKVKAHWQTYLNYISRGGKLQSNNSELQWLISLYASALQEEDISIQVKASKVVEKYLRDKKDYQQLVLWQFIEVKRKQLKLQQNAQPSDWQRIEAAREEFQESICKLSKYLHERKYKKLIEIVYQFLLTNPNYSNLQKDLHDHLNFISKFKNYAPQLVKDGLQHIFNMIDTKIKQNTHSKIMAQIEIKPETEILNKLFTIVASIFSKECIEKYRKILQENFIKKSSFTELLVILDSSQLILKELEFNVKKLGIAKNKKEIIRNFCSAINTFTSYIHSAVTYPIKYDEHVEEIIAQFCKSATSFLVGYFDKEGINDNSHFSVEQLGVFAKRFFALAISEPTSNSVKYAIVLQKLYAALGDQETAQAWQEYSKKIQQCQRFLSSPGLAVRAVFDLVNYYKQRSAIVFRGEFYSASYPLDVKAIYVASDYCEWLEEGTAPEGNDALHMIFAKLMWPTFFGKDLNLPADDDARCLYILDKISELKKKEEEQELDMTSYGQLNFLKKELLVLSDKNFMATLQYSRMVIQEKINYVDTVSMGKTKKETDLLVTNTLKQLDNNLKKLKERAQYDISHHPQSSLKIKKARQMLLDYYTALTARKCWELLSEEENRKILELILRDENSPAIKKQANFIITHLPSEIKTQLHLNENSISIVSRRQEKILSYAKAISDNHGEAPSQELLQEMLGCVRFLQEQIKNNLEDVELHDCYLAIFSLLENYMSSVISMRYARVNKLDNPLRLFEQILETVSNYRPHAQETIDDKKDILNSQAEKACLSYYWMFIFSASDNAITCDKELDVVMTIATQSVDVVNKAQAQKLLKEYFYMKQWSSDSQVRKHYQLLSEKINVLFQERNTDESKVAKDLQIEFEKESFYSYRLKPEGCDHNKCKEEAFSLIEQLNQHKSVASRLRHGLWKSEYGKGILVGKLNAKLEEYEAGFGLGKLRLLYAKSCHDLAIKPVNKGASGILKSNWLVKVDFFDQCVKNYIESKSNKSPQIPTMACTSNTS